MTANPQRTGARLIAADRVEGTKVFNPTGERLGEVERVFIDKTSGQAEFATLHFGGFLGMGAKRHPVPWDALTYDPDRGGYVINVSKDALKAAPAYEEIAIDTPDHLWRDEVRTYYAGKKIAFI